MSIPVDRREWCAARGLAKPGTRGRFSAAAWDAMDEAERAGTKFIDPKSPVTVGQAVVTTEAGETKVTTAEVNPWAHHRDPIRSGMLTFTDSAGHKHKVNSTEVCIKCMYSFGWCYCDIPTFRFWRTGEVMTLID